MTARAEADARPSPPLDPSTTAKVVFLAGFPLRSDESCAHAAVDESSGFEDTDRTDLGSGFVHHCDGTVTLTPAVARACLYNDVDDPTVAWARERLRPHPLITLGQSPDRVAWTRSPRRTACAATTKQYTPSCSSSSPGAATLTFSGPRATHHSSPNRHASLTGSLRWLGRRSHGEALIGRQICGYAAEPAREVAPPHPRERREHRPPVRRARRAGPSHESSTLAATRQRTRDSL